MEDTIMAQEFSDPYEAVIADLESQKATIDQTIANLKQLRAKAGMPIAVTIGGIVAEIPSDAFLGLSIGDAAKKYLGMVRQKKTTSDIADGLEKGGVVNQSKNFYSTVFTALTRASSGGGVVKIGNEWGLAEWYPHAGKAKKTKMSDSTEDALDEVELVVGPRPTT